MDFKKEFQKRIASEFDLNTVISRSLLVEKQKDFSDSKNVFIRSLKTVWVGTDNVERSTRQNFVASKLKINFFVLLPVALLVLQA